MRRTLATLVLAGALALPVAARAQPGDGQKRAAVRKQIADYAMTELTQKLGLEAATAAKFREVSERYQLQIAGVHREVGLAMRELKAQLAAPTLNDARLAQLADTVVSDRQKVQALEAQRTAEYRRVLSPAQFARLIVTWPQINRQIRVEMWKAMHGGQPPAAGEEIE
jgi:Spy/CpxP family protein refolding chaperone